MIKKSVLLTALAIAGFAVTSLAQTVPNYVPSNGLVGWWPFNGNAIDESINTNDGTVNGATLTADRFGSANSAYYFSGAGCATRIDVPLNTSQITTGLTLSYWTLQSGNGCAAPRTMEFYTAGDGPGTIGTQNLFNYNLNSLNHKLSNNQVVTLSTTNPFNFNNWFQITYTNDGTNAKLYQNGILVDTATVNGNPILSANFAIGRMNHPAYDAHEGKLDDIGIWNRALTQQEITTLYNGNLCFQTITVTDTLLINTTLTGFNPVTYQNTIKIWPNPTNDHITIDNGNLANLTGHQIKISNALGQQVFQSAITQQQFYVNMSTWGGNGIYFVNLINAQGVTIETRKIVLQ